MVLVSLPFSIIYQVSLQNDIISDFTDISAGFNWAYFLLVIVG